jgi:hypothetical protein
MKFIGLFLMFLASFSLSQGVSLSSIGWFFIGLTLTLSDVIIFWMKEEIRFRKRRY